MALQNLAKARFAPAELEKIPGVHRTFSGRTFNEFTVEFPRSVKLINHELLKEKIVGPYSLGMHYPELTKTRWSASPKPPAARKSNASPPRCEKFWINLYEHPNRPKATEPEAAAHHVGKVRSHPSQNEGLIFEHSLPGKRGMELPPLDVPAVDPVAVLGAEFTRASVEGFPEVSEIEVIRHFTRLSTWNYAIDLGMYPLGSCTMKYNPRVNEFVARLEGLATEHPSQPAELSQGCLQHPL